MAFKKFTKKQELKIKNEFLLKNKAQLARELNCSVGVITRFLKRNNLIIPPELTKQRQTLGNFKKGHKPFNLGLKMEDYVSKESIDKIKSSQYKKGHKPFSTRKDGDIRISTDKCGIKYKYIRISVANWKLLHRVVWEKANGSIPEKQMVSFIDGNSMNVDISNLELITPEENMYRNSKNKYPKEIIPSLLLLNKLNKKLKDGSK